MAAHPKKESLTDTALRALVAKQKSVINDGGGLLLRKRSTGYFWYYRNTSPETKRETWHSLAERTPYPQTTLANARALAKQVRGNADLGVDVKQERKREAAEKQRIEDEAEAARIQQVTFREAFDRWLDIDLKPALRTDGKRIGRKDGGKYVREQFTRHVFGSVGNFEMKAVTKAQIMAILDKHIAAGKLRTANMVLSNLKQFFRFAVDREIIIASPIDTIKKEKIGGADVKRKRFLSDDEIVELLAKLPSAELSKRAELAIWLTLATGVRVGELMGAAWSDSRISTKALRKQADICDVKYGSVDIAARQWYLPDTKNERDHTIHLSDFALAQLAKLRELREHEAWIFPDTSGTKPVCVRSFGKQLADRQRAGKAPIRRRTHAVEGLSLSGGKWTAHDLRRTAGTVMASLGFSTDVIHECLNHIPSDAMTRVYIQNRREPEQIAAFDALGRRLKELLSGKTTKNVVSIRRKAGA
jgi:integrase